MNLLGTMIYDSDKILLFGAECSENKNADSPGE